MNFLGIIERRPSLLQLALNGPHAKSALRPKYAAQQPSPKVRGAIKENGAVKRLRLRY
jgi:hypothetical protein